MPASRVDAGHLRQALGRHPQRHALSAGRGGGALKRFVERGGGVLVVAGDRTAWPPSEAELLPGQPGRRVDRMTGRSATLGYLDYSHPDLRSVQGAAQRRLLRRAHLPLPRAHDRTRTTASSRGTTTARWRRRSGRSGPGASSSGRPRSTTRGRTSRVKPVYLPLVHQLVRYLAPLRTTTSWFTVGQVVDLAAAAAQIRGDRIVVTPSGQRTTQAGGGECAEGCWS